MAAVPKSNPKLASPPGYEVIDRETAVEALGRGDLVVLGASGISKAAAGALDFDGVALKDYYAGEQGCDYLVCGEVAGYNLTGVNPGTNLYPSASVAGGIDTTVPATIYRRMKALRNGIIRFNCV